jgi:exodeoxyribonuclease-3
VFFEIGAAMRVITLNCNGIRAAFRKGLKNWLSTQTVDFVCLQETRIQDEQLTKELRHPDGVLSYFTFAEKKGYSGVGIYTRHEPESVAYEIGWPRFDEEGRFVQVDYPNLRVVSLYLPSGTRGDDRQMFKMEVLEWFVEWFQTQLQCGKEVIVCGDINIAHQEIDLKNWKANQKNSGFLPEERAWLTKLTEEIGFVDVFRSLRPEKAAYTWWSNRGRAWDNNVGWRIDYQLATPALAKRATDEEIYREERFSDHAPLRLDYQWEVN